jgi:outer membrane protein assembly factor BamB
MPCRSQHSLFLTLQVLLLLCPILVYAENAEWGRFRGPNGSGISDAKTIPTDWGAQDYNWTVRLPGLGYGSPVVWGNRIYLTSGDEKTGERRLVCLNASTGETRWQKKYPAATYKQHRDNAYAASTPTADAQGVVISWATPGKIVLLALDPDGNEMWRRDLGPYQGLHGGAVSPIIVGERVVLPNDQMDPDRFPGYATGQPGKSFLIAVDRTTGQTRWKLDRQSSLAGYSIPCLHRFDGGEELIFTSTSHGITAVNPETGHVNWELPDVFPDRCVGSPLSDSGLILAGFGYGLRGTRFVAVRPERDRNGVQPVIAYDVKKSVPLVPTALAKEGLLYLWADDGIVTCLELASGNVLWRERVRGKYYGSPVWVDGTLYCITRDGEVVVLAASKTFKILARIPLGEPSNATPAVASGVMYLRTNSRLFSLGGAAQAD